MAGTVSLGGRNNAGAGVSAGARTQSRAAFAIELVLLVALAFLGARIVWSGEPRSARLDAPRAQRVIPEQAIAASDLRADALNPFGARLTPTEAEAGAGEAGFDEAPISTLDLQVVGVRTATDPAHATAIIAAPDSRQRVYRIGDEIINGVILRAVESDRVVVARNGATEILPYASRRNSLLSDASSRSDMGDETAAETGAPVVTSASVSASALAQSIAGRALEDDGGVRVQPTGSGEAFAAAGFVSGDVITAVNGQRITNETSLAEALAGVSAGDAISVDVLRDEVPRVIEISLE